MVDLVVHGTIVNSFSTSWLRKSYQKPTADVKGMHYSKRDLSIIPRLILNFFFFI